MPTYDIQSNSKKKEGWGGGGILNNITMCHSPGAGNAVLGIHKL